MTSAYINRILETVSPGSSMSMVQLLGRSIDVELSDSAPAPPPGRTIIRSPACLENSLTRRLSNQDRIGPAERKRVGQDGRKGNTLPCAIRYVVQIALGVRHVQ